MSLGVWLGVGLLLAEEAAGGSMMRARGDVKCRLDQGS